jgi:hypothetical protein
MYLEIKRFNFNSLVPHISLIEPKPSEANSFTLLFNLPLPCLVNQRFHVGLWLISLDEQCSSIFQAFPGEHEGMNARRAEDEAGKRES